MAIQDISSVNTFFVLLRAGLYGSPVPASQLPEEIDWTAVTRLAKMHAVLGLIIDSVQYVPERLRPSSDMRAKMNRFALSLIQSNMVMDKTAARLAAFLGQHGFKGVLLKGQGVARSYYRMPQMRQLGDIDFYVGKTAYKQAAALCKRELADNVAECHETEQHFNFSMSGIPIELHRIATRIFTPFRSSRFQNWLVEGLEHSPGRRTMTVDNVDITLPSYDFDAIYIFYHAWRHFITGGIGLRQLCDWTMVFNSHADDIDTDRLKTNIARFGLTQGWELFACIAVNHLGLPEDKMPLYDPTYSRRSEKILEEIVTGGNFGYYSESYLRTKDLGYSLIDELHKVRNITDYFIALFPIIPVEATFLSLNRLFSGSLSSARRFFKKSHH